MTSVDSLSGYARLYPHACLRREAGDTWALYSRETYPGRTDVQTVPFRDACVLALLDGSSLGDVAAALRELHPRRTESEIVAHSADVLERHGRWIETGDAPLGEADRWPLLEFASTEERRLSGSQGLSFRLSAPVSLYLMLTPECDYSCRYCNNKRLMKSARPGQILSPEVYVRLLTEAKESGCVNVTLTGGDPLRYEGLRDVVSACNDLGLNGWLCTRGARDAAVWEGLLDAGLQRVQVSLDSLDRETVDRLSGPGTFDRSMNSIRALLSAGAVVALNTVLTSYVMDDVEELVEWALEKGVRCVTLSPFVKPLGHDNVDVFVPAAGQKERFGELVSRRRSSWGDRVAFPSYGDALAYRIETARDSGAAAGKPRCDASKTGMCIKWDGSAIYCDRAAGYEEAVYGNVATDSLLDLWNGERLRRLATPARGEFEDTVCAECSDFDACTAMGRCYYYALLNFGRFFAPDWRCPHVSDGECAPML